ncbi:MAG: hypothetical protein ABSD42_13190 [Candidatus Bathyarchaeia archaeon]|jgi:hypothetical protein
MDLIIGGGKYGCNAIEYLRQKRKSFVVVDVDPCCLAVQRFALKSFDSICSKGEYFVVGDLHKALELMDCLNPEYIFPTAPVHIAADMAKIKFNLTPWSEAINSVLPKLPEVVVLHAGRGKLILSFNRDNDCLDNCAMPTVCPSSGTKKPCTMISLMRFASPEAFILISYSMAPGMGALKGSEVSEFFDWVKTKETFVVGTACDCHGFFSAFRKFN